MGKLRRGRLRPRLDRTTSERSHCARDGQLRSGTNRGRQDLASGRIPVRLRCAACQSGTTPLRCHRCVPEPAVRLTARLRIAKSGQSGSPAVTACSWKSDDSLQLIRLAKITVCRAGLRLDGGPKEKESTWHAAGAHVRQRRLGAGRDANSHENGRKRKVALQRRFTWCTFLAGKRCECIARIARCR